MAKTDSRYIQFYSPGSVACKVELRQEREWAPLPQPKAETKTVIAVDPVAVVGFLVAVCMLILMAVGIRQLNSTRQEVALMERYVAQLTAEHNDLVREYNEGYDLEDIRRQAVDLGMVPAEEVKQIPIYTARTNTAVPQNETQNRFTTFISSLFS